ncbi:MAG: hypothetical protein ACRYFS_06690 [Janthinobacterium lividum]
MSSSTAFQDIYWRCVALFFASSVRHNPDAVHKLFTTVASVPNVGNFSTSQFLTQLGVEVVQVPFVHLPPLGYYGSWRNQFYILDIINYLDRCGAPDEQYVILDSDCVFTGSIQPLSEDLSQRGLLAMDLDLPLDQNINGITQRDMKQIFEDLGQPCSSEAAKYYGGEFFAATTEVIHQLAREVEPLWEIGLARFQQGKLKFNEEAHFLSYLYAKLGYAEPTGNPYIGRIWTGLKFCNTSPKDFDLIIWHVPAEKKHGIRRLFQQVIRPGSRFWTVAPGRDFSHYVAGYLGIPKSSLVKKSRDVFDTVTWRIAGKLTQKKKSLAS